MWARGSSSTISFGAIFYLLLTKIICLYWRVPLLKGNTIHVNNLCKFEIFMSEPTEYP